MTDLFGNGFEWPYRVGPNGRLMQKAGQARTLDSVDQITMTPQGICPMDPQYGMEIDAYQLLERADVPAWVLANAVEYGEPRAEKIDVIVESYDPINEVLEIRVELTPIGENTPLNRVLNLFELG